MAGLETNLPPPRTLRMVHSGRPGQTARLVTAAKAGAGRGGRPVRSTPQGDVAERRTDASARLIAAVLAIGLHLALLAALISGWHKAPGAQPAAYRPVAIVSLARPEPQQAAVPLKPDEPVSRAEPMPLKPRPAPVSPSPEPAPPATPEPAAMPAPPATEPPPPPQPAAPAAPPSYAGEVMAKIMAAKRYPASSRARREEGTARIAFTLSRDGGVSGENLVASSGHAALDKEALATVRRAAPYPAVPAAIAAPLDLQVDIAFKLKD